MFIRASKEKALVEDRRDGSVCGSVESIEVDYKERTLKHKFVIY